MVEVKGCRTGFQDSAGKDIYDGDVVMPAGRVNLEVVDITKPRMGLMYRISKYRVIGNKYKNPGMWDDDDKHLLEG